MQFYAPKVSNLLRQAGLDSRLLTKENLFKGATAKTLNRVATNQIPNQLWQMYQDKVGLTTPV